MTESEIDSGNPSVTSFAAPVVQEVAAAPEPNSAVFIATAACCLAIGRRRK
jgi:hypothetical protein